MPRLRTTTALICTVITLVAARPAAGADLTSRRDQTKARHQELQGKLDLARSSDLKVQGEVDRLTKAVQAQQSVVEQAVSDMAAAQTRVSEAGRRLDDLVARSDATRRQLTARAVDAYMDPAGQMTLMALGDIRSLDELARRNALMQIAQNRAIDLLDSYRALRADQLQAKKDLEAAKSKVAARAQAEADEATKLLGARQVQQAAHDELQKRIGDLLEETKALAAQEGQLESLIRSQEALVKVAPTVGKGLDKAAGAVKGVISKAGFIWPIGGVVTSEFGPRWGGFHPGIDIAGPTGTPIHAAKDGVVIQAGWFGGYGNFVVISHGGGLSTAYGHQSRIACTVGQTVKQGDVIGYRGSTGFSTGPHLHFEVRVDGTAENPRNFLSGNP